MALARGLKRRLARLLLTAEGAGAQGSRLSDRDPSLFNKFVVTAVVKAQL